MALHWNSLPCDCPPSSAAIIIKRMDVNPKTKLKMDFQRQITTVAMQSPGVYTPGSPPRGQTQPILRRSSTLNSNNSFTADNGSTTALHPVKVKETIKKQVRHGSKLPIIIGGCLLLFVVNILVSMLAVKLFASGDHEMKMCVPCATLVLGDEELDDYREYFHQSGFAEGKPKCCAKTTEQFQIMMGVVSIVITNNHKMLRQLDILIIIILHFRIQYRHTI